MRTTFQLLTALTAFVSHALADFYFSVPKAGGSYPGGTVIDVTLVDTGDAPTTAELSTYNLWLCAGGSTAGSYDKLLEVVTGGTFDTLTTSVTIPLTTGGDTPLAYFFMLVSTVTAGGTVTDFSDRFTLTGMTGTFSTTVTEALADISGDSGPVGINTFAAAATTAAEAGSFTIPYYLQTGLIKYAPMQPLPGTKITATGTPTPLYPTSSYSTATTYLASPSITLTVTDSQTFSVSSAENTIAAVQARATDAMGSWMRRWAD